MLLQVMKTGFSEKLEIKFEQQKVPRDHVLPGGQ